MARLWQVVAALLVAVKAAKSGATGSSEHVDRRAVGNRDANWCRPADRKALEIYRAEGLAILKNFIDEDTLAAVQRELERVVDTYAEAAPADRRKALDALDFTHKYAALHSVDDIRLPTYFRAEMHTASFFDAFLKHDRLRELLSCLLDSDDLRIYPVYMARGKVPDRMNGGVHTVDWHQDAEYTYYWYSPKNTTVAEMDAYAASVVNTWLAVEDVPLELGPVQLVKAPVRQLTKADFVRTGPGGRREALRVGHIDEYVKRHPEDVVTATVERGDLVIFDQYVYHRALPNTSENRTRWSLDFRFQRADHPTLRGAQGFQLDDLDGDKWARSPPSPRLYELRKRFHQNYGGNSWAKAHDPRRELRGAVKTVARGQPGLGRQPPLRPELRRD